MERASEAFGFVAGRLPLTEVYNNLGVVEARKGRNTSIQYLEKAVEADPTDEDYHFNLAVSLAHLGDKTAAIRQLKEALNLRPTDAEARNYLEALSAGAAAHPPLERIKRNYDEASFRQLAFAIENAQEIQMAHSNPKKHAAMHVDEGKQQLREGFYEEAREHFRKALALDPDNTEAHIGLANAQTALNDLGGARSELETVLHDKPSAEAYAALALVELKDNKFDAASQYLSEALRLEPSNTAALQLRQEVAAKMQAASQPRQ
jgi:Flp pilus assembly protein TadD